MDDSLHCGVECIDFWRYLHPDHDLRRNWNMDAQQDNRLGVGHYKLCLVDRYWSRRYFDFSDPLIIQAEMEDGCKQGSRSDDDLCGNLCSVISSHSRRKNMGYVLFLSISKHTGSFMA